MASDVARPGCGLDIFERDKAIVFNGVDILEGRIAHHEIALLLGRHLAVVHDDDHFGIALDHRFPADPNPVGLEIVNDVTGLRQPRSWRWGCHSGRR